VYYVGDLYILFWGAIVVWKMPHREFTRAIPVYGAMIIIGALMHIVFPGRSPWPENGAFVQRWFHEQITFDPYVCLPSMHVALTVLPACMTFDVLSSRSVRIVSTVLAALITVSTITLKEHYALDAVAGTLLAEEAQIPMKQVELGYVLLSKEAKPDLLETAKWSEEELQDALAAALPALRAALAVRPERALVDGNRCPRLDIPVEAVVKGDGKVAAIAAASILAKTVRDAGMRALDAAYPEYGFARHMGYPTEAHCRALREHGATPAHRRSFGPVAQLPLL
jgi:ribonuclease HII